jgi:Secretion system C-terminal sorting domain
MKNLFAFFSVSKSLDFKLLLIIAILMCAATQSGFAQYYFAGIKCNHWEYTDTNNNTWNDLALLDQGKVFIQIHSVFYNQSMYDYLANPAMHQFYAQYGPSGSNQVEILVFIYANDSDQLDGTSFDDWGNPDSAGDWYTVIQGLPMVQNDFTDPYPFVYNHIKHCTNDFSGDYSPINVVQAYTPDRKAYIFTSYPGIADLESLLNIIDYKTGNNNASLLPKHTVNAYNQCPGETRGGYFWLSNNGSVTMTSATLGVAWDGVEQFTTNWSGSLPTYAFDTLDLYDTPVTLSGQTGAISVYIKSVNGVSDVESANDSIYIPLIGAASVSTDSIFIDWKSPVFPEYVYWDLVNEQGDILFSEGDTVLRTNNLGTQPFYETELDNHHWYHYAFSVGDFGTNCMKIRCFSSEGGLYIADTMYVSDGNGNLLLYFDYENDLTEYVPMPLGTHVNYSEKKLYTTFVPTNDLTGKLRLRLYPNPTDGVVIIEPTQTSAEPSQMWIINALGQQVAAHSIAEHTSDAKWVYNTSALPVGIYYVFVQNPEGLGYAVLQVLR